MSMCNIKGVTFSHTHRELSPNSVVPLISREIFSIANKPTMADDQMTVWSLWKKKILYFYYHISSSVCLLWCVHGAWNQIKLNSNTEVRASRAHIQNIISCWSTGWVQVTAEGATWGPALIKAWWECRISEGWRTWRSGGTEPLRVIAERFHPVVTAVSHQLVITVTITSTLKSTGSHTFCTGVACAACSCTHDILYTQM